MTERAIRFWKRRTSSPFSILPLLIVMGASIMACANDPAEPPANTVSFRLDFGGGVTLSSVDYVLTGPNSFRRVGTLTVGDAPNVTATFQNLPAGQGYNIRVKGTAIDNTSVCQGELTFDVTSSMTATLSIPLMCSGLVTITGVFDDCPVIDELSAIPAEVHTGGSIPVTAVVHDGDNTDMLTPTWAVMGGGGGTLSNLSTAGATFTCTASGTFTVGLRISDGHCNDSATVTLVCS